MSNKSFDQPNIVFVFSDQQRWDTCGCYGQELDLTPNLDRLAREGVKFDNAFSCQPVCGPARAALQTGKYPTEIGCHTNNRMLPKSEETLATLLRRNGYEVGYIGKWHLASCGERDGPDDFRTKPVPRDRRGGYEDFWLASDVLEFTSHSYDGHMFDTEGNKRSFPEGRYRVDAQTDWVLEYLETRTQEQPFFLCVSYLEPHHQNDNNRYEGPTGSEQRWANYTPPGDLKDTEGDWRENFPDYLGCIHSLDENLGRIRDKLEELNIADNTLLIYTSDHGSHFRTRNREYKRSCHESSIHVPLVIRGPGFEGGRAEQSLVSLIDLPPTVVRAGGVTPPASMRGRPLQELMEKGGEDWPDDVFVQISESHCGRAIRTSRWKYAVTAPDKTGADPDSNVYEELHLYDLWQDPYEKNDLVLHPDYEDVRAEMRERLKRRMAAAGEAIPEIRAKSADRTESNHKS